MLILADKEKEELRKEIKNLELLLQTQQESLHLFSNTRPTNIQSARTGNNNNTNSTIESNSQRTSHHVHSQSVASTASTSSSSATAKAAEVRWQKEKRMMLEMQLKREQEHANELEELNIKIKNMEQELLFEAEKTKLLQQQFEILTQKHHSHSARPTSPLPPQHPNSPLAGRTTNNPGLQIYQLQQIHLQQQQSADVEIKRLSKALLDRDQLIKGLNLQVDQLKDQINSEKANNDELMIREKQLEDELKEAQQLHATLQHELHTYKVQVDELTRCLQQKFHHERTQLREIITIGNEHADKSVPIDVQFTRSINLNGSNETDDVLLDNIFLRRIYELEQQVTQQLADIKDIEGEKITLYKCIQSLTSKLNAMTPSNNNNTTTSGSTAASATPAPPLSPRTLTTHIATLANRLESLQLYVQNLQQQRVNEKKCKFEDDMKLRKMEEAFLILNEELQQVRQTGGIAKSTKNKNNNIFETDADVPAIPLLNPVVTTPLKFSKAQIVNSSPNQSNPATGTTTTIKS